MQRESWDSYFMSLAVRSASRATCLRRKVGSILVQDKSLKGSGYNGAPSGTPSCMDEGECLTDESGKCQRCIHAETNLILQTSNQERQKATVYVTDCPCWNCALMLANSGISRIVYMRPYKRTEEKVRKLMEEKGIILDVYEPQTEIDFQPSDADSHLGSAKY